MEKMLIVVFKDGTCLCLADITDLRHYIGRSDVLRFEERLSITAPALRVLTLKQVEAIRDPIL